MIPEERKRLQSMAQLLESLGHTPETNPTLGEIRRMLAQPDEVTPPQKFLEWWRLHFEEWCAIRDEMLADGKDPSAHDVSSEQYRRMNDRGESVFEARKMIQEFAGSEKT